MVKPFYIDEEECIGDGSCADICPDCFSFERGMDTARVIGFDCDQKLLEEAMENCPTRCIHYEDEGD
jgi:ferredoxin